MMNAETAGYEGLVTQTEEGPQTLSLLIGGVHCAACIQKIESALYQNSTVQKARLNFSTGRLEVNWNGDAVLANEFAAAIEKLGYQVSPYNPDVEKSTADAENRFLLLCLGVAGFAMGNIMLLSVGLWVSTAETMGVATRELLHWIAAIIAIPTILFSGRPFFRSAYAALKNGHTNMDVPISLALILATSMSVLETMRGGEHVYFDSAVMLTFFLLIGRYLDFRARRSAKSAATGLMSALSGFATIIEDGQSKRILIRDLREGMVVSVAAGEKFPVDGLIQTGRSSVDTSLVTGETMPREITEGENVYAGTLNLSSPVTLTVAKAAEDSLLADIVRLMEKAEQGQAHYVRLADRAAQLYTPVVHTLAAAAFIIWWGFLGLSWQDSLMISVTVLIITCPCALGLAVPVVQVLATGRLMKNGVLVKSGDALERLAKVDTILFDKTGTLTLGTPQIIGEYDPKNLQLAACLAQHSQHPLSKALSAANQTNTLDISNIEEHSGRGLSGLYKGKKIKLGSRAWCGNATASPSDKLEIWLKIEDEPPVVFYLEDQLRVDTKQTIQELSVIASAAKQSRVTRSLHWIASSRSAPRNDEIHIALLSGDRSAVAQTIAAECGIQTALGDLTPPQKYEYLENLKAQDHQILMVGDGLNDTPALAAAHVSMAPGTAIDIAQNTADIVFMGDQLAPVAQTYKTAQLTQTLVKQNFMLAVLYNIVAIPLAFMGFVTPMIAALAMSGSSLIVIANSFRLKWH